MSIILDKVNYIYGEGSGYVKHALKDINLVVNQNEFIGLIGHTGSGKSTLTQIMNGLIKPSGGNIYFDGQDINEKGFDKRNLRFRVGLVFQYPEHQLFEETVFKDVCFGPKNMGMSQKDAELRAFEALEMVGVEPENFYHSPFELSGGQKRRVAIAGVLAMRPDYLILDEPTAGLDPEGRDSILDMLKTMHKELGTTVILVSHSMEDVAKYVDRILVMNQGELIYDDVTKKIFSHYRELEQVGLAAPEITYIMNALRDRGFEVDVTATTVSEGCKSILNAVRKKGLIC
ncbi:MAG: energy-coupling factor transporter ATPase [Butyrivibrio sp.]